jgi:hypothetical protein
MSEKFFPAGMSKSTFQASPPNHPIWSRGMSKADYSVSVSPLPTGLKALNEADVISCLDLSVCDHDCLIPANMYTCLLDRTALALLLLSSYHAPSSSTRSELGPLSRGSTDCMLKSCASPSSTLLSVTYLIPLSGYHCSIALSSSHQDVGPSDSSSPASEAQYQRSSSPINYYPRPGLIFNIILPIKITVHATPRPSYRQSSPIINFRKQLLDRRFYIYTK